MDDVNELRKAWLREDFAASETIAAGLSLDPLARRGASALEACVSGAATPAEVRDVLRIAHDREQWAGAHAAFSAVRDRTLAAESSARGRATAELALLYAAENVARLLYNATDPPDPFDADSGAWMLHSIATLVRFTSGSDLGERVWSIIARDLPQCS
jgi:hypothetical protein